MPLRPFAAIFRSLVRAKLTILTMSLIEPGTSTAHGVMFETRLPKSLLNCTRSAAEVLSVPSSGGTGVT